MGRVNKLTNGVFVDIVGNENDKPAYDRFINLQPSLVKPKKDLSSLLSSYKKKVSEHQHLFEELSLMETIIMQMRSRDNITKDDIKLNIVRDYIYARIPFHRVDKEGKDIRVIVGLAHRYDTKKLYDNTQVMDIAKNKLTSAMECQINDNIKKLEKLKA